VSDLKESFEEAVRWYEPDPEITFEGARDRLNRRVVRRKRAAVATSLAVFALGAVVLWAAFRTSAPTAADLGPTGPTTEVIPGARITVASGDHPEVGAWELWVTVKEDGIGTHITYGSGGGGGCCSSGPLRDGEVISPDMSGWISRSGGHVTAFVTDVVDRVAYEELTGERIEGTIYPIPGEPFGLTHMALVFLPAATESPQGDLFAYDEAGSEVGRVHVGEPIEAPGPTAEIDRVWTMLREARDMIQMYSGAPEHDDTLNTFNLQTARQALPTIQWNESPVAIPNEVSIRGLESIPGTERGKLVAWKVAIVSATPSGETYCIAITVDEFRSSSRRYGIQDAQSYDDCEGGWPGVDTW
jgi:hypothetical protein